MSNEISRLEILPNELFLHVFRYISSTDLFQIFFFLNSRFHFLLQTFPYLSFTPSIDINENHLSFPYIRALIINRGIPIDFHRFTQIRFLILRFPTETSIDQFNPLILPSLEHFRLNHIHSSLTYRIPRLCEKIFTDRFPRLISCYLFQWGSISPTTSWTFSVLKILKIGSIDLFTYKTILSICPNLFSLQCATIRPNSTHLSIASHRTLKRLIIKTTTYIPACEDDELRICLSLLPHLEYLRIYRSDCSSSNLLNCQWLACSLPCLYQLDYFCHIDDHRKTLHASEMTAIQKKFTQAHRRQSYQSRLIFF